MPVVGHAFAGIVVAHEFAPGGRLNPKPAGPIEEALWMPALIAVAYVPDAAATVLARFGQGDPLLASHSIPLGALAGLFMGVAGVVLTRRSPLLLAGLAIASIVGHDVLDLFQATDRSPFWPFTKWGPGSSLAVIPDRLSGELLVFAPPFACYALWRLFARGDRPSAWRASRSAWIARALVLLMMLTPLAAYSARRAAEREVRAAQRLLRAGRFAEALTAADAADRWSWIVRGGRTDLVRGEAYEALGDERQAELHYLRAYRLDPNNFWAVAGLAEYYASHGDRQTRRQRASSYASELRQRFAAHPSRDQVLARIEMMLSASPAQR